MNALSLNGTDFSLTSSMGLLLPSMPALVILFLYACMVSILAANLIQVSRICLMRKSSFRRVAGFVRKLRTPQGRTGYRYFDAKHPPIKLMETVWLKTAKGI